MHTQEPSNSDDKHGPLTIPFQLRMREVVVVMYLFKYHGRGNPIYAQYCLVVGRAIVEQALAYRMATHKQTGTTDEVRVPMDAGDLWQQLAKRGATTDDKVFTMIVPSDFASFGAIAEVWQQVYDNGDPLMIGATDALVGYWALEGVFSRKDVQDAYDVFTATMDI